jgi:MFS family permease
VDSPYAWWRLGASLALSSIGGVGIWSVVVVLPAVQAEFAVDRGTASIPYTATMLGFGLGGVLMGHLTDRFRIILPVGVGALALLVGYVASAHVTSLWQFSLIQGVVIGFLGCSSTFGPLVADVSHWFRRRRGIAVAICASGNYLSGTIWPPIVEPLVAAYGWRATHVGIGLFCAVTMLPLLLALRRRAPRQPGETAARVASAPAPAPLGFTPNALQALLVLAGLSCCIAMSMPQVHIVAYAGDLGHGVARGAEMLALMLGFGVISRMASGWIADRIGGVRTFLAGTLLQCVSLALYLPFESLMALYLVSALFGLSQGGIVPSYAIIVREQFPASETGVRVGLVFMATTFGMALGGWLTGLIFDLTGSYHAGFTHGILWNLLNISIALWLFFRTTRRPALA